MASPIFTYDLRKVQCIFGPDIISGYAEGDGIEIEYDEESWTYTPSADGGGTRSKTNQLSAVITIHLMQTSPANQLLQNAWNADNVGNAGLRPLLIKDGSGNSLHASESCWVEKLPGSPYNRAAGPRDWTLRTQELITNLGGNG